jgi:hypothetical protein
MEHKLELDRYYQSFEESFSRPHKEFNIICINNDETFQTKSITIYQDDHDDTFLGIVKYRVIKCDNETTISYTIEDENLSSITMLLHSFFRLLWTSSICNECFGIVIKPEVMCKDCQPMKILYSYGIVHNYITNHSVPTCSICFDPVYYSKLKCGHYVHKTCMINMNTSNWFRYEDEYKCPICRTILTEDDKIQFFLMFG